MAIIDHVEVRDEAQDALMLLYFDLLGCDFIVGDNCVNGGYRFSHREADIRQLQILTGLRATSHEAQTANPLALTVTW